MPSANLQTHLLFKFSINLQQIIKKYLISEIKQNVLKRFNKYLHI